MSSQTFSQYLSFYCAIRRSLLLIPALLFTQFSQAVMLSQDGSGQVLIFPYYDVNDGKDNHISLLGTEGGQQLVRILLRNGHDGRAVLEADLYLSGGREWAATITRGEDGLPSLISRSNDCTQPAQRIDGLTRVNAQALDQLSSEQANRGYVEVYSLGKTTDGFAPQFEQDHPTGNCQDYDNHETSVTPESVITGQMVTIDVAKGMAASYGPTALKGFNSAIKYSPLGSNSPTLAEAEPFAQRLIANTDGVYELAEADYSARDEDGGLQAVRATLINSHLYFPYITDASIAAQTQIVFVDPTKISLSPEAWHNDSENSLLVDGVVWYNNQLGGQEYTPHSNCEPLTIEISDRTKYSSFYFIPNKFLGLALSPVPPATEYGFLCAPQGIIDSRPPEALKQLIYSQSQSETIDGHLVFNFTSNQRETRIGDHFLRGSPMIGISLQQYVNGTLGGPSDKVLANYSVAIPPALQNH